MATSRARSRPKRQVSARRASSWSRAVGSRSGRWSTRRAEKTDLMARAMAHPGLDEVRVDVEAFVGEAVEVGGQQRRSDRVEVVLGGRAGLEPPDQQLAEVAAQGRGADSRPLPSRCPHQGCHRSGGGPHALACAALLPDLVTAVASLASLAPYGGEGRPRDGHCGHPSRHPGPVGHPSRGPAPMRRSWPGKCPAATPAPASTTAAHGSHPGPSRTTPPGASPRTAASSPRRWAGAFLLARLTAPTTR